MRAEIISVGTELLLGDIVNTNAQYLARELAALGFAVYNQSVVGDNAARLRAAVLEAKERSDLLVFTGGLGPTDDDLTKETVAEAFGDTLYLDEEELANLEGFFQKQGRPMPPNNAKQAMVPRRGKKLPNSHGTAPGAFFRQGGRFAVLLPGPPREMRPMFENEVRPLLEEMQDGAIRSRTLHVIGRGESDLELALLDLIGGQNPTVALYAKEGEVHVRVTARAATAEQADHMCSEMGKLIVQMLGDIVYSDDDSELPATVVGLLAARGATVALAESCTGGLLAQRITAVPGASAVFGYGAVSYANAFKRKMLGVRSGSLRRHGAVSSQVCAEMAFGAAKKGKADYGVGITGIAGPEGGSEEKPVGLVYVGVAAGRQVALRKLNVAGRDRDYVRIIATQNALDMLRRVVLGLELPGAKWFTRAQHADFERLGRPRRRGGAVLRAVVAALLVAGLVAGFLLGNYLQQKEGAAKAGVFSAQGLSYGSREYTEAVQAYIREAKATNPAVAGFVALPGGRVESLVAQTRSPQAGLPAVLRQAGAEGMAVMGENPALSAQGGNTVLAGGGALRPLLEWADTTLAGEVSRFGYFTENGVREYQVFAAAYLDEKQHQPDGFDPSVTRLESYGDYLRFLLGAQGRSLYTIPLNISQTDSFMTLRTEDPDHPGRWFFVFGRLAAAGETSVSAAATAGQPLMPAAWYEQQGLPQPDFENLYGRWLRGFLMGSVDNMDLQLQAGMPEKDSAPVLAVYPEEPEAASGAATGGSSQQAGGSQSASSSQSAESETPLTVAAALRRSSQQSLPASGAGESASVAPQVGGGAPAQSGSLAASAPASNAESASSSLPPASSSAAAESRPEPTLLRPDPRFLTVRLNGVLVRDTVANVLAAVCQSEMPAAPPEAVKAQAVAVHSWVLNQQGAGNPAPSLRGAAPSAEMRSLAEEVSGQVLSADGYNPAFSPWFAMAAQGTCPAQDLWGVSRSYLPGVATPGEARLEGWRAIISLPRADMEEILRQQGFSPEEMGEPYGWIDKIERDDSGYVKSLAVGGQSMSGLAFWREFLLQNGAPLLPSPAFELEVSGDEFHFTVYGKGHGVGLSQAGAGQQAANEGWTYERILEYYYPETSLMAWN